jgi:hypothetical protein
MNMVTLVDGKGHSCDIQSMHSLSPAIHSTPTVRHGGMQSAYSTFVHKLEESARQHLRRQLEANTSQFTLNTLMMRLEGMDASERNALGLSLANQVDLEESDAEMHEADEASHDSPGSCSVVLPCDCSLAWAPTLLSSSLLLHCNYSADV